ncbi:MAG: NAD(P)-binding domain-containing protein [Bacteroides sp.]|nr:NAD(P)-binding domain-containing protein [Bacteroides sp.]
MKKLLLTQTLPREGLVPVASGFDVDYLVNDQIITELDWVKLGCCEALLPTYTFKVTRQVIDRAPALKIIANFGAGYDHIDVAYARKKGIWVTNSPEAVVEPTAEHTFALMMAVARRIGEMDRKMRSQGSVHICTMGNLGQSLSGKRLGILGLGRIGRAVARRALAFGMKVVYRNRHRISREEEERLHVHYLSQEELLHTADVISLHVPSSTSTHHLIGEAQLRMMKKEAIFINTARGALVDEEALIRALTEGWIWGAGLDVFEHEPQVPSQLLSLDNVVLSPHNGTGTMEARIAMTHYAAENIRRYFAGEEVLSIV